MRALTWLGLGWTTLVAAFAGVPDSRAMSRQAAPSWWASLTTTGGQAQALTPGRLRTFIDEADAGYPSNLNQLLSEIGDRDLHMVAVLGTRAHAVAGLDWSLKPVSEEPADVELAKWCEARIRQMAGLHTSIFRLMGGVTTGIAAAEIDWAVKGGEVVPLSLLHVPSWWMRPDPNGGWLVQTDANLNGEPLTPYRWVAHSPAAKDGLLTSGALGRVLAWAYLWKVYVLKDWVAYCEKFGSPLRLGKYPAGTQDKDIQKLGESIKQLGIDAWAVVPKDMDVSFPADSGFRTGGPTYKELLTYVDEQISKVVVGQTLTTQAADSGTQALGSVHNDVRQDIRDSDALQVAETLTRDLVTPLVLFNKGAGAKVPTWVFDTQPPEDEERAGRVQESRGRVFKQATELGVPVPMSQLREELGIREPKAGEPILVLPAPASPFNATPRGVGPAAALAALSLASPPTPLTATGGVGTSGCCVCGHTHGRVVSAAAAAGTPVAELEAILASGRPELAEAWRTLAAQLGEKFSGDVTAATLDRAALAFLKDAELGGYSRALSNLTLRLEALGHQQVLSRDKKRVQLPSASPADPSAAEAWASILGQTAEEYAATVARHERQALDAARHATLSAASAVVEAGRAEAQGGSVAERVAQAATAAAADPHRVDAVADAAGSIAWQAGRQKQQDREAARLPFWRYRTMADNAVRPTHRVMEGWIARATAAIWQVWRPPNGWGCRCWLEAWRQDELKPDWKIRDANELPQQPDGRPLAPDGGWSRNHLMEPHEYKWDDFSDAWRRAVGAPLAGEA